MKGNKPSKHISMKRLCIFADSFLLEKYSENRLIHLGITGMIELAKQNWDEKSFLNDFFRYISEHRND